MTDTELNEAVARKLRKPHKNIPWHQETNGHRTSMSGYCIDGCAKEFPMGYVIPDYCGSIQAAWEIIRYCEDELVLYQIDLSHSRTSDTWFCTLGTRNQENSGVGADTAARAICEAFLKLDEAKT